MAFLPQRYTVALLLKFCLLCPYELQGATASSTSVLTLSLFRHRIFYNLSYGRAYWEVRHFRVKIIIHVVIKPFIL